MNRPSLYLWLTLSLVAPAVYVAAAFAACGVGHGDCRLMILFPLLFPFALLFSEAFPSSIGVILTLALAQFPLYVMALDASRRAGRHRLVRNLLVAAHGVAVLLAFVFWG
jgi:hypothetical protein